MGTWNLLQCCFVIKLKLCIDCLPINVLVKRSLLPFEVVHHQYKHMHHNNVTLSTSMRCGRYRPYSTEFLPRFSICLRITGVRLDEFSLRMVFLVTSISIECNIRTFIPFPLYGSITAKKLCCEEGTGLTCLSEEFWYNIKRVFLPTKSIFTITTFKKKLDLSHDISLENFISTNANALFTTGFRHISLNAFCVLTEPEHSIGFRICKL